MPIWFSSRWTSRFAPFQSGSTADMRGELLLAWAAALMVLLIG